MVQTATNAAALLSMGASGMMITTTMTAMMAPLSCLEWDRLVRRSQRREVVAFVVVRCHQQQRRGWGDGVTEATMTHSTKAALPTAVNNDVVVYVKIKKCVRSDCGVDN